MPVRLYNLRGVPEDEAEEIRQLLSDNAIDYYETPAGNWGISSPAFWLHDSTQLERSTELIDDYQRARAERVRDERRQLESSGAARSIWDELRERPLRFLGYVAFALVILYFSTKPFVDFGR